MTARGKRFPPPGRRRARRILITGANSDRARAVLAALPQSVVARAVDVRFDGPPPPRVQQEVGDLRDEAFVSKALAGVDAVLHLAPLSPAFEDETEDLDHAGRGTFLLLKGAAEAGVQRAVIGSSLGLFSTLPASYSVGPAWRPRPQARPADLRAWGAEQLARERARETGSSVTCLRLGETSDAEEIQAIVEQVMTLGQPGWEVKHIGERPAEPALAAKPAAPRPVRKLVIFGAGGPLGAAAAEELKADYALRLTDLRPLAEIEAAGVPQMEGAPVPQALTAPHECRVVDVTDAAQVMAACEGMDAILNCTVIRKEIVGAFRVNYLGAYHIMQAAVAHGIQRVVHTGPYQIGQAGPSGYDWDTWVVEDVPPRPSSADWDLYFPSKLLGQEACRIFAAGHGLSVPCLLFKEFVNPTVTAPMPHENFLVSWPDAGRAIRAALEVKALPSPFEILHINSDAPHGVFPNDKAKRVLGWQPRDDMRRLWSVT